MSQVEEKKAASLIWTLPFKENWNEFSDSKQVVLLRRDPSSSNICPASAESCLR